MNKNILYSTLLGLLAAVVYFASCADYAFPGESAALIAAWRGVGDASSVNYPLMAIFAKLLGGGNLIAPICGALSVMMLFALVSAFVEASVVGEQPASKRGHVAHIAATTAVIVFMLTPAVRSAATHLEPRLFDFTWALACFLLSFPFLWSRGRLDWLFALILGLLVALGANDSAIFLALMPFFLALIVLVPLKHGNKPYLSLFLFLLAFFVFLFLSLGWFGQDVLPFLRRSAQELRMYRSVPGWLFVFMFTTLPFVGSLFSSVRAYRDGSGLAQWIFHVALTFTVILVIATPLSPSALMEPYGILPVVTSAFAAMVAGYLASYWYLQVHARGNVILALVAGSVLLLVIAVTSVWNLFSFDGQDGAFADKVAAKTLDDLGGRQWLVTDGSLDSHLALVAAERGKKLNLINLARDLDDGYLEKLGELIKAEGVGGSKNGELRLSLSLGVLPFVQDWFASDPSVRKEVAIWGAPDIWYIAGITPVPEFLFFGADETKEVDWSAWAELDKALEVPKGWGSYRDRKVSSPVERLRYSLRRHVGLVANDRGVYLQDKGRNDEAWKMYELVLNSIDHDNICSIFNEVGMTDAKHPAAVLKKRELERMLKTIVEDTNRRYILWGLGNYYGYIRNPDIFIRLGHTWAKSGRPGDAISQIRRAIDFVPTDKRSTLINMLASLYASENDQRKSRSLYEQVLKGNANDHDALVGLMQLELQDGNNLKALAYLERAAQASELADKRRAAVERAMLAMMKDDAATARGLLQKAIDQDPKDMQAWSLLATVSMQLYDSAKTPADKKKILQDIKDNLVPRMEREAGDSGNYYVQTVRGFLMLKEGGDKRREAREAFAQAMVSRPDSVSAQNLVMGLDISLNDKVAAETHARDVLRRNRNAPLANYVMGSLALDKGNFREAEVFLRKAADAPQPVVMALNDLAEVLRRNKNLAEAERYARMAVKSAPNLYVVWETLGSILMDAGKNLDEAEAVIRKACQLSKSADGREADVRMLVSLARVQIKRGDKLHAKVTIRKVQARLGELSDFEKKEFDSVKNSVR